ncbi:DNA cytosine methyltransferase [Chengkuizengella sp. SCS-71B]|uniref:DNA cytosine methyltransferase n=1 Tax=Chengkuizengella sp. SCS-71B TaxID=3115290 RepID=UPI0032C21F16
MQLDLFREIIVDNFAGGGGASTGIEMATGLSVDIAINHDPAAIAMHKANHPDTEHYCEDVWDVDPKKVVRGRKVGLCWLSPDCTHHSKARGGKPRKKNIRGLAWIAVRWAIAVKPRVIILENVEEFKEWGPLDDSGMPIKDAKGRTFYSFVDSLKSLGYQVEWRELTACDYGAPTKRKRLFMIARCDGRPIVWAKPTHGDPKSKEVLTGKLLPWRTTAEIIDWSLPCPSIFERKRPLAENTMRRIARGMQKFVINNPKPFIVRIGHTGFGGDRLQYEIDKPLTTITTKAEHCLVTPFISTYYTETTENGVRGQNVQEPLHTVSTANRFSLVTAFIAKHYGGGYTGAGTGMTEPLSTVTTVDHNALVMAFLTKYYGSDIGQALDDPIHTITTKDRFGLVKVKGQNHQIVDIGMRMLQPHELFPAQGFPERYIIDRDYEGNKYTKTAQIARCGNAVPPPFADALVRANCPELCYRSAAIAN